jgi:hypothetical protein
MKAPPKWERSVLQEKALEAKAFFRKERLVEPVEDWRKSVAECQAMFSQLFRVYGFKDPSGISPDELAEIYRSGLGDALRYLAGPPISDDDLKVVAESSLSAQKFGRDPAEAARVVGVIAQAIDRARFPWVLERREPTNEEVAAAALSSAVLMAAQRISTKRRHDGKNTQENSVKGYLKSNGFSEVQARSIGTLDDAPKAGQFCGECLVGSRKADIPVRLFDGRLMPIECKVSNSSTNSVKRLNNDAAVKAAIWHKEFGTKQVVPTAVLSGVFKVLNLEQAQEGGLTLFWAHNLTEMGTFIEATKAR